VRFDWSAWGATAVTASVDAVVVVDVLFLTASLTGAADTGTDVWPNHWDDRAGAEQLAASETGRWL
jgi:hypothetical protein